MLTYIDLSFEANFPAPAALYRFSGTTICKMELCMPYRMERANNSAPSWTSISFCVDLFPSDFLCLDVMRSWLSGVWIKMPSNKVCAVTAHGARRKSSSGFALARPLFAEPSTTVNVLFFLCASSRYSDETRFFCCTPAPLITSCRATPYYFSSSDRLNPLADSKILSPVRTRVKFI